MFKPKCGIAKDLIPFEESASDFDDRSNEEACGSETEKLNVTPGFPDKIKAGDVLLVRFLRKKIQYYDTGQVIRFTEEHEVDTKFLRHCNLKESKDIQPT